MFREIVEEQMRLSRVGQIAQQCWNEIPTHFPNVELSEFVVMPNHVHGIIIIAPGDDRDDRNRGGVQLNAPTIVRFSPHRGTLSVIVRTYKAAVTTWCRKYGSPKFRWQRNYYEHIVRTDREFNRIREYIQINPLQWARDEQNADK